MVYNLFSLVLDTVEVSLTLESTIFELHGWLDATKIMLFFLQAPALHSINVLLHFFRSHLNPNARFGLEPTYKDLTLAMVRFVVFLKNGKVLCWKLAIEFSSTCAKIFREEKQKKRPETSSTFLSFSFLVVRTVAFPPWALSRASFDDKMIHATFAVYLTFEVWKIYAKCVIDISMAGPPSGKMCEDVASM